MKKTLHEGIHKQHVAAREPKWLNLNENTIMISSVLLGVIVGKRAKNY